MFHEYLHIITDPAHVGAEITVEIVQAILLYPILRRIAKRFVRDHDAKHH